MVKSQKEIIKELKLIDVVIEMLDARIPMSSRNPDVDTIVGNKKRIIVLNKKDLADEEINKQWKEFFSKKGITAIFVNSIKGEGLKDVLRECRNLMRDEVERMKKKGIIHKTVRALIIGIPNVGKSSFINKLANKSTAKTGGIPGVTKMKQWIKISKDFELLDTPGILWPKFEDKTVAQNLAFTGAVKDEIVDINELTLELIKKGQIQFPGKLQERYKLERTEVSAEELMRIIGEKRGCMLPGGEVDYNKVSNLILDDFRNGRLGRISLEKPN